MNKPYTFVTTNQELNEWMSESSQNTGYLEEAIALAREFDADITLNNEPGFVVGHVHADGTYKLG